MWAIGAIVVVVLALVGCFAFCIYKKCLGGKKKAKKVRERKGGRRRVKKEGADETGEVGEPESLKHVKGIVFQILIKFKVVYCPYLGTTQRRRGRGRERELWQVGVLSGL